MGIDRLRNTTRKSHRLQWHVALQYVSSPTVTTSVKLRLEALLSGLGGVVGVLKRRIGAWVALWKYWSGIAYGDCGVLRVEGG